MIKTILLAEDDRGTALMVRTQLESKGYIVKTAANGVEAIKILEQIKPDLIITDVVMPIMDGVDLYRTLKKSPLTDKIPIIIVTDKAVFKESFQSLGVMNFVEKTTDITQLLNKIQSIEKIELESTNYRKIIINSSQHNILTQMQSLLQGMKYLVSSAHQTDEIISKSLVMVPDVIVLDVLFQDQMASSPEIIKALRTFSTLKNSKIITYAYFPENLGMDVDAVHSVELAMNACYEAGANKYIGRFNQGAFLEYMATLHI